MIDGIPTTGLDTTFDFLAHLFGPSTRKASFSPTHQYADFEEMKADFERRGTITVSTAHSESTVFATPHLNACFRYWHDMAHIATGAPFTAEGERTAATYQAHQVYHLQGPSEETKSRWYALIDCEVNGQTEYFMKHGSFPDNQRDFARMYLAVYHDLDAETFPHTLDGLTIVR